MLVRLNLESNVHQKIKKLIEDGHFENEHDFIRMAINNELEEYLSQGNRRSTELIDSEINLDESVTKKLEKIDFEQVSKKLNRIFEQIDVSIDGKLPISPPGVLYGPSSAGLIWVFQNRFFPVKVIVFELLRQISQGDSKWIDLEQFKDDISDFAIPIGETLQHVHVKNNELNLAVGFPVSKEKLLQRHGKRSLKKIKRKQDKEDWLIARYNSGRKRFADQFLGKFGKKDNKKVFTGACFEMGLLLVSEDSKKITLSSNGRKFASLQNPVIDNIQSDTIQKTVENIFSKEEVDFILENVLPLFPLEEKIVQSILSLESGTVLTAGEAQDILEEQKRIYLANLYDKDSLENFEIKYKDEMEDDEETKIVPWLAKKSSDMQIAATLRRMSELGILCLKIEQNVPSYTVVGISKGNL
ncbi:hypothetical protein [Candidatus Nitrosopumilus sediminis]|uniref:Uncharacterized protein n=1 Tax=Candidatus Nitrosopumilus sediminis TaxID=1229909 RepID=K0BEC3_9ARCH|nr:hypothetical protein [Candidatus Nitrosopumilus sediminis]AFS83372.1 hypothetical protein NSED_07900 [Candidatus Nitrosopumilus sediminis]